MNACVYLGLIVRNSAPTALKVDGRKTVLGVRTFSVRHLIIFESAYVQLSEFGIIK